MNIVTIYHIIYYHDISIYDVCDIIATYYCLNLGTTY